MFRALIAALIVGCNATKDSGGIFGDTCNCVWEGPVEYTLERAWQDGDTLYAEAALVFVPCCAAGSAETVQFSVALDGSTQDAAPAGEALSLASSEPCVSADLSTGQRIELACAASDSVDADQIEVGTVSADEGSVPVALGL